ncbi:O-antigen ligase family protein [Winogradskyella sp.]|uniref:O-antigen ligase family protein n=1 Tax=Winogradskyella sp. TaxID=1883156 RepID=UPI003AB552B5
MDLKYIYLLLFHIVVGACMYFIGFFPRAYFFIITIYFIGLIIVAPQKNKKIEVLKACAYLVGIEVLFRMTNGAIFYEASKYLVIVFILMGMFYNGISNRGYPYFIFLILLVPSIIVASMNIGFDSNFRTNVAFVLTGPVCLGLSALYCLDKKVSRSEILEILLYLALPIVALTTYLFIYSPSIKDTLSGTQSNYAASGGFGPNQVATMLGVGMFVFCVFIFLKSKNLLITIINCILFGAVSFRAIVTFSRGGVITAIMMIIAFMFFLYLKSHSRERFKIISSFSVFSLVLVFTWMYSTVQTEGLIENRYTNKDGAGREKKDVTTGRLDLFLGEIDGFTDNPFLGVGANGMKELRIERLGRGVVSHNEISRLLSEHGILGIIILLILIFTPLAFKAENPDNIFFYAFLCFWFATINHSAMRIAAPSFIYGLTLLYVFNEKRPVHRKRLIK